MLQDLRELSEEIRVLISERTEGKVEFKFNDEFKNEFKRLIANEAIFDQYTCIIPTTTKKIVAPSLWFYIAALLTPLLEELKNYRYRVTELLEGSEIIDIDTEFEEWADNIRKGNLPLHDDFINFSKEKYGEEDTLKISKFLTDYKSWGGGKSIGRSQADYYHSAILKVSGLLNESSGYVSSLTWFLLDNPSLRSMIVGLSENTENQTLIVSVEDQIDFDYKKLIEAQSNAGLRYLNELNVRFVSSLLTKPFVILTGLSGSGKTKLAQSFVQWISQDANQYCIVPVGADWTNREPLLGFPNALDNEDYVKPDNNLLDLILKAINNPELPYFLILDEMNLSHVERYFADFLSVMESNDVISLHSRSTESDNGVPNNISIPSNLFIVGTVNIDETTYMFSPKVLDRANTIEFRINEKELGGFLNDNRPIDMNALIGKGANMAVDFLSYAKNKKPKIDKDLNETLVGFFNELKIVGAEFGYRTANEIQVLIQQLGKVDSTLKNNVKLDIAIMQKLLPKLHGSRRKLEPILLSLGIMCVSNEIEEDDFKRLYFSKTIPDFEKSPDIKFRLSLEKICRMYQNSVDHGFASYAEA